MGGPQYDNLRRSCWRKTGCLITADGTDDELIKPEGLPQYTVPPPSILDPNIAPAMSNEVEPSAEQVAEDPDISWNPNDDLLDPSEEAAETNNIFDIIDNYLLEV